MLTTADQDIARGHMRPYKCRKTVAVIRSDGHSAHGRIVRDQVQRKSDGMYYRFVETEYAIVEQSGRGRIKFVARQASLEWRLCRDLVAIRSLRTTCRSV